MVRLLPVQKLDRTLSSLQQMPRSRPAAGWLRSIRKALGMTTRQLARLVGVAQGTVVDAEAAEGRGNITLATLRRYAAALDCELVYALVPRRPLQTTLEERADRIAREQVGQVQHSMALEGQATSKRFQEEQIAELRQRLLAGKHSRLWR